MALNYIQPRPLITPREVIDLTPTAKNLDTQFIKAQAILEAQRNDIKPLLGTALYDRLMELLAPQAITITDATNASPIVLSLDTTGISNGDFIYVVAVQGNTAANGIWEVANVTPTDLELVGAVGNGTYKTGTGYVKAVMEERFAVLLKVLQPALAHIIMALLVPQIWAQTANKGIFLSTTENEASVDGKGMSIVAGSYRNLGTGMKAEIVDFLQNNADSFSDFTLTDNRPTSNTLTGSQIHYPIKRRSLTDSDLWGRKK